MIILIFGEFIWRMFHSWYEINVLEIWLNTRDDSLGFDIDIFSSKRFVMCQLNRRQTQIIKGNSTASCLSFRSNMWQNIFSLNISSGKKSVNSMLKIWRMCCRHWALGVVAPFTKNASQHRLWGRSSDLGELEFIVDPQRVRQPQHVDQVALERSARLQSTWSVVGTWQPDSDSWAGERSAIQPERFH